MARKPQADWMAWVMHGIVGLMVGGLIGFWVGYRSRMWLHDDVIWPLPLGTALIGPGLGSRYGDRLWLVDSYRVIPPNEPVQSPWSAWISWWLIASGCATVIVALLKTSGII
jgi:hypothetical protein